MHSFWGFFIDYQIAYFWILLNELLKPFTFFIPVDLMLDILFQAKLNGIEKYVVWYFPWLLGLNRIAGQWLHIEVENGWTMLDG